MRPRRQFTLVPAALVAAISTLLLSLLLRPAGAFRLAALRSTTTTTTMKASSSAGGSRPGPAGRVAVIGGGIAGLACAKELQALGLSPVVFDTGVHAPGGRCSTRALTVGGAGGGEKQRLMMDHSAQFLSVPADLEAAKAAATAAGDDGARRWLEWVGEMEAKGLLREWDGARIGTLEKGGKFTPREKTTERALVGVGGMRAIPNFLAEGVQVDRPKWVSKVKPLADGKGWRLWHYQELIGVRACVRVCVIGGWVGRKGMGGIVCVCAERVNLLFTTLTTKNSHAHLQDFSYLVIAHNGS